MSGVQGSRQQREPTRVLITGAIGFVGRHLMAHLLSETATGSDPDELSSSIQIFAGVHRDDIHPDRWPQSDGAGWSPRQDDVRVSVIPIDICHPDSTLEIIKRIQPHHIYHLAARASGADADRNAVFETNVTGTRNLLEAASCVDPLPRVLLASTGYVYGDVDPARPAKEEDPIGPLARYGIYTDSKIEMEAVAQAYGRFTIVGRAFAHTGPGQLPQFAVPSFALQLARIERGEMPAELSVGNLDITRDMLDVRDVVHAYRLLMHEGESGEVYNISLGSPTLMRTIVDGLRDLCSVPTTLHLDPSRLRAADIHCSTGDHSKLTQRTAWEPGYRLDQTLRDTLDYWRSRVRLM